MTRYSCDSSSNDVGHWLSSPMWWGLFTLLYAIRCCTLFYWHSTLLWLFTTTCTNDNNISYCGFFFYTNVQDNDLAWGNETTYLQKQPYCTNERTYLILLSLCVSSNMILTWQDPFPYKSITDALFNSNSTINDDRSSPINKKRKEVQ